MNDSVPSPDAPDSGVQPLDSAGQPAKQRPLLGLLVASLYGLFTLLPDSSTLMVSWVWVLIWQLTLLCPVLWLMIQTYAAGWRSLGRSLDWIALAAGVTIIQSGLTATFPQQARWAGIAALCHLGALYACHHYFHDRAARQRVLVGQGLLQVAFIVLSLSLWTFQTWLPELDRLRILNQAMGLTIPFSFGVIENRNWAPIGHQNYVAGYLTLAIPSLAGLSWTHRGRLRWIFAVGCALGLVALYTTSSRAGWLGLILAACIPIALHRGQTLPIRLSRKQWLGGSAIGILTISLGLWGTGRLEGIWRGISGGYVPGELAYRVITNAVGWAMGLQAPIYGLGLGNVPHLFQKFRPFWGGREAEWAFQLHSTPAQLWGELGLLGIGLLIGTIVALARLWWKFRHRATVLTQSLFTALFAYIIQSFSDYQLDNLCITGSWVIFLAAIASELNTSELNIAQLNIAQLNASDLNASDLNASQLQVNEEIHPSPASSRPVARWIVPAISGVTLAAILWLIPVHRAWMLSSQGFQAIASIDNSEISPEQKQAAIVQFTQNLEAAHQLAPWEPYYPQQLGWVLGDLGLKANRPDFLEQSIRWLNIAQKSAPYQEFGYSNLGWLQLNTNPKAASEAFQQAAQLVPAKRGVFYGLGMSLLFQNRMEVAIEALALEMVRDPIALTYPWWQTPQRRDLFQQVVNRTEAIYTDLISQATNPNLVIHLQGCRSSLRWWIGKMNDAQADANNSQFHAMKAILALQKQPEIDLTALAQKPYVSPETIATLTAWLNPNQRRAQLQKAWFLSMKQPIPPKLLDRLQSSMDQAKSFDQWLKQTAPKQELRRQRSGFGVLSRHIDGVIPTDFLTIEENVAMTYLIRDLIYEWKYYPDLEKPLQVLRDKILTAI